METARMVYRSIKNDAPNYLTSLFERLSPNTVRELGNTKTDLKLPLLKTSSGQRYFSYKGARLRNNLSADANDSPNLSAPQLITVLLKEIASLVCSIIF